MNLKGFLLALSWPFVLVTLVNFTVRHVIITSPTDDTLGRRHLTQLPEPKVYTHYAQWYKAWSFERPEGETNRVVHFFHGNGRHPLDHGWQLGELYVRCNCTLIAVAYLRGGTDERQVDLTVSNYLNQFVVGHGNMKKDHYLYGVSLGAAAALKGTRYVQPMLKGIILENPFTSLTDLLPAPLGLILYDKWDSLSLAECKKGTIQTLVLSSGKDEIVPPVQHVRILHAISWTNDHFQRLEGANHGDAPAHPDYWPAVERFLN